MIFILIYIYSYVYLCIYTPSYHQYFRAFPVSDINSETSFLYQLFKKNSNFIVWKPCKMFIYVCMYACVCIYMFHKVTFDWCLSQLVDSLCTTRASKNLAFCLHIFSILYSLRTISSVKLQLQWPRGTTCARKLRYTGFTIVQLDTH